MDNQGLALKLAKALGYWDQQHDCWNGRPRATWDPQHDDGDALRLAVHMEMDVFVRAGRWTEAVVPMGEAYKAMHGVHGDANTATRFAICMAALLAPKGNPADWSKRMRAKLDAGCSKPQNDEFSGRR